ncbi:general secretion pathway protein G [Granulicella pectinivorans]|uniref:General secretion pathway protein G n=1 Tax=Granulicella pectinivorans TaxID=474950 RepID=A0A1I6MJP3_9BACT|nr:type II secretion system protein [Granulicella pectinivorans]SFS15892.1 general secretion pathway protein G [Granulicella pectinivorans]
MSPWGTPSSPRDTRIRVFRQPPDISLHPDSGLTLVELIVVAAIIAILAGTAAPIAKYRIKTAQETELRTDLQTMRDAIDQYKHAAELGAFTTKLNSFNYPPDLQTLVDGVDCTSGTGGKTEHVQFLRKIPKDPMTGQADWTVRSMEDDPGSDSGGGESVFDVHSKSDKTSIAGTKYNTW